MLKVSKQMSTCLMQSETLELASESFCKDKSFVILLIWVYCCQIHCVWEEAEMIRILQFLSFKKNHLVNKLLRKNSGDIGWWCGGVRAVSGALYSPASFVQCFGSGWSVSVHFGPGHQYCPLIDKGYVSLHSGDRYRSQESGSELVQSREEGGGNWGSRRRLGRYELAMTQSELVDT